MGSAKAARSAPSVARKRKRPRDPNQLAKLILDITTGDVPS
jgi:hypothetical protein